MEGPSELRRLIVEQNNVVSIPLFVLEQLGLIDETDAEALRVQWWKIGSNRIGVSLRIQEANVTAESQIHRALDLPGPPSFDTLQTMQRWWSDNGESHGGLMETRTGRRCLSFITEDRSSVSSYVEVDLDDPVGRVQSEWRMKRLDRAA